MTELPRRGAAVLGSPIAHSLSPALHRAAYEALGLTDRTYRAVQCSADALSDVLRELEADGLAGASLTMPLKRAVLPLLARVEHLARDVEAANTVLFGGVAGEWWGGNTDVPGMVAALGSVGVSSVGDGIVVLGAGATAASAIAALSRLGARSVTVVARRLAAVAELEPVAGRFGVAVSLRPWNEGLAAVSGAAVVVSTVPAGATDALAASLGGGTRGAGARGPGMRGAGARGVLFDVVYAPWPTALASAWSAQGGRVVGGLELLVEQAALQVTLMTGKDAPVDVMRSAGEAALRSPAG